MQPARPASLSESLRLCLYKFGAVAPLAQKHGFPQLGEVVAISGFSPAGFALLKDLRQGSVLKHYFQNAAEEVRMHA